MRKLGFENYIYVFEIDKKKLKYRICDFIKAELSLIGVGTGPEEGGGE